MEKKVIDQKEYLKKYLSSGNGDEKKKKKKKKMKVGLKTVKIIDDDIDLKNMRPIDENDIDIFIDGEEAPQIAGIVDERGPVDFTDRRRWKIISDNQDGDLTVVSHEITKKSRTVDNDLSPPRKRTKGSDSDMSPPRMSKSLQRQKNKASTRAGYEQDSDLSPPRRKSKKHDSDDGNDTDTGDTSHKKKKKMKKRKRTSDSDLSPPRQKRDNDSDMSPPRKSKEHRSERSRKHRTECDSDLSPPRKSRRDSDSDLSPPRRSKKHKSERNKHRNKSDSDASPPRRSRRNSDSDLSPPRNRKSKDCSSDLSPPRKHVKRKESHLSSKQSDRSIDLDLSPPRKHKHKNSHRNMYKEKRDHKYTEKSSRSERRYDSDSSPPRRKNRELDRGRSGDNERDSYKSKNSRWNDRHEYDTKQSHKESSRKKERFTRDTSDDRRIESRRGDDERDNDKRMKKTLDGKTAGLQDARALREETEAHRKREAEQFNKLSKEVTGVGQATIVRDSRTGRKRDLEAEAAKDREKQKRQTELDEKYAKWGKGLKQVEDREEKLKDDLYEMSKPLARYADDADLDRRLRDQEREGDPMLEYIKQKQIKEGKRKPDRPSYEGSFMPNRFGIKPGHRWDGVDRSNGYEKRWFEAQNAKVARQEEAYKWSTSDM